MTLEEFKELYPKLFKLLSALHFNDTLHGVGENGVTHYGLVGLDEHGVLRFGGSTIGDLISSGNTGWAAVRQLGNQTLMAYNSTGLPNSDFGATGDLYEVYQNDETTGWGPYISYTAQQSLGATLIGIGAGLLTPLPIIDEVVGGFVGFALGTYSGLTTAPAGEMKGDQVLTYYYADPSSGKTVLVETTIIRGNQVIQSSVEPYQP